MQATRSPLLVVFNVQRDDGFCGASIEKVQLHKFTDCELHKRQACKKEIMHTLQLSPYRPQLGRRDNALNPPGFVSVLAEIVPRCEEKGRINTFGACLRESCTPKLRSRALPRLRCPPALQLQFPPRSRGASPQNDSA